VAHDYLKYKKRKKGLRKNPKKKKLGNGGGEGNHRKGSRSSPSEIGREKRSGKEKRGRKNKHQFSLTTSPPQEARRYVQKCETAKNPRSSWVFFSAWRKKGGEKRRGSATKILGNSKGEWNR